MNKGWMAAVAALMLVGCATYSSIKDRAPLYEGTSTKSPDAVATCVLPAWMGINAAAHVVADGDRRVVVVPTGGLASSQVLMTLTASPVDHGSSVAMRTMPSMGKFKAQWDQAQACM